MTPTRSNDTIRWSGETRRRMDDDMRRQVTSLKLALKLLSKSGEQSKRCAQKLSPIKFRSQELDQN